MVEIRQMMRAIVFSVLLLSAPSVLADRVKVAETADTAYYVDPASISAKDGFRLVSVIHDYSKQEPAGARSRSVSYEIDCAEERLRSIAVTEYSEPMAGGQSLNSRQRESEWLYVAPRTGSNIAVRTPYKPIVRFVCSR
jgi:hypothetical protein